VRWHEALAILMLIPVICMAKEVGLQWDPPDSPGVTGYKIYARATTDKKFTCLTTLHTQTSAKVKVDGRRSWWFYVTARNAVFESRSSNNVFVGR
jgi:hypothetical protein